jgi:sulfur relay (sulfurtransferase) complex TusBCD TusD component (DsrE family)
MRIGMLLASGPERRDRILVLRLAEASLERGHGVHLFLMKEGVECVRNRPDNPIAGELDRLMAKGMEVTLCSLNARRRGMSQNDTIPGVAFGSQYDHARLVAGSDRYLAFA